MQRRRPRENSEDVARGARHRKGPVVAKVSEPMWVIENMDDEGDEGMFVCNAPTKKLALKMHEKKNRGMKVTSCERVKWVDLALVTGELGESYYFQRQANAAHHRIEP